MKHIRIFCLFYLAVVILFTSCTKNKPELNPKNNNPTPIPPAKVGAAIIPSAESITLHPNDVAQLTAKLYNTDGSVANTQPVFNWTADTANIVTANNGSVTAKKMGTATVTVSDGQHIAYVYVSVVGSTTTIPSGPADITFNSVGLSVATNGTISVPSFTITDSKGQLTTGDPVFFLDAGAASTINNNTLHAGGKAEAIALYAKIGNNNLSGSLPIFVYANKTDTIRHIGIINAPIVFWYYNKSSAPLQLNVQESFWNAAGWNYNVFSAAPQKVTVAYPAVIKLNGDNSLTSVSPGITTITVSYKNASATFTSGVDVDFSGSWGGTGPDGTTYNFCLGQTRQPIMLGGETASEFNSGIPGKSVNLFWKGGAYVGKNGTTIADGSELDGGSGASLGPFASNSINYSVFFSKSKVSVNTSPYKLTWVNTKQLKMNVGGASITMDKGKGNCNVPVTTTQTITQLLLSTQTWLTETTLENDLGYGMFFTFDANGNCSGTNGLGTDTGNWTLSTNNVLTFKITGGIKSDIGCSYVFHISRFYTTVPYQEIDFSEVDFVDPPNSNFNITITASNSNALALIPK